MSSKNPIDIHQAAKILVDRRVSGEQGERLPEASRPRTLDDALTVQAAVSELWCVTQDDSIGGWKCLLPPTDKLVVGPIYTSTIDTVPPLSLWAPSARARIEPELVFIFGKDLPAREQPYTPAEVDTAIVRTHMALELIQGRYRDPASASFAEMLADGLVNQGLFIGPEVDSEAARGAGEIAIKVSCSGGEQSEHSGVHPNGNPRAPLYWLTEFLRSRGEGIVAGQAVITGSYAGVLEVPLNEDVTIDYLGLGSMTVSFSGKQ
jgi:2-keto-4-pentenoate hydratase